MRADRRACSNEARRPRAHQGELRSDEKPVEGYQEDDGEEFSHSGGKLPDLRTRASSRQHARGCDGAHARPRRSRPQGSALARPVPYAPISAALIRAVVLTSVVAIAEVVGGLMTNSIALIARRRATRSPMWPLGSREMFAAAVASHPPASTRTDIWSSPVGGACCVGQRCRSRRHRRRNPMGIHSPLQ